jgi:hypothetical protein
MKEAQTGFGDGGGSMGDGAPDGECGMAEASSSVSSAVLNSR